MILIYRDADIKIYHGDAVDWVNDTWVDFIFTNPYGPMPLALAKTPGIIHQWEHRRTEAERWSHMKLSRIISKWNRAREVFWANTYVEPMIPLDLSAYAPEPGGWYPPELVDKIIAHYVRPGQTVWDGFMGRGTIGRVCRERGIRYIGVEQLSAHVAQALDYLEIAK